MSYDPLLEKLADYIHSYHHPSQEALKTARLCLADALGCAMLALQFPECTRLLGPWTPGTLVPEGCPIPGTDFKLDPVSGAFTLSTMIRWLDYNDTFLAKEWAHPSDMIGALIPVMRAFTVHDLLIAIIKAYEIQGGLSLENSFNAIGLDHVILVKVAIAGLTTHLLGGTKNQIMDALSQAFIDLGPTRAYRHAPNTGSRKSWAAGDAASRGVQLALLTLRGEPGYQTPLSAPKYGLEAVLFNNKPLVLNHTLGSYIIENILFKISYPAEFHAQTVVEAALALHSHLPSTEEIESIEIATHEPALRIIDKKGPLHNPADRDHCMQYMVAIALLHGHVKADHYQDKAAQDPRIDALRSKMHLQENPQFTKDYYQPDIRSIASTLTIQLKNGTKLGPLTVEFPLGHKRRRQESLPLFFNKLNYNLSTRFPEQRVKELIALFQDQKRIEALPIPEFLMLFQA